jgi:hypothetical protein
MKIEEIERELPNGFHDALLHNIFIDYGRHEAVFEIGVRIGTIDSDNKKLREAYRRGRLELHGLRWCIIEAPDPSYPYCDRKLTVSAGTREALKNAPQIRLPEPGSEEEFVHWFFVRQWNAFIYVSAADAKFERTENPPLQTSGSANEKTD